MEVISIPRYLFFG